MHGLLIAKIVCLFVTVYYTIKMFQTLSALRSVALNNGHAKIESPPIYAYQTMVYAAGLTGFVLLQWVL